MKIVQKLPTKRKYKLSPTLNSPSKDRRQFSQPKIIVDEVQASPSIHNNSNNISKTFKK